MYSPVAYFLVFLKIYVHVYAHGYFMSSLIYNIPLSYYSTILSGLLLARI